MMNDSGQGTDGPVSKLIDQFHKLPGIGPKTAQRLTYYLIRMPEEEAKEGSEDSSEPNSEPEEEANNEYNKKN